LTKEAVLSQFDYLFKTIIVGDGAVGKTALSLRFTEDKFQDSYKMTIGVDFSIKRMVMGGKKVKIQLWDTGGQERFSKIRPLYYRGALGCLIVFDVTNKVSFGNLAMWFKEVQDNCITIPILLIGNKIDLKNRQVSTAQGKYFASKKSNELGYRIPYLETSAKTGETIKKVFSRLTKSMVGNAEKSIAEKEAAEAKK